uniref:Integrase p58-like C-terminal domain-containing protein n=1 Tax=Amphimedon queenslandica TaxID=400682 RepID=A0A1X7TTN1_AMPQE
MGPYNIVNRISRYIVRILLVGGRKNLVVHINRLKPYKCIPYQSVGFQSQFTPTDTMTVTEKTSGYVCLDEEEMEVKDEGTIGTSVAQGRPQWRHNLPDWYRMYNTH